MSNYLKQCLFTLLILSMPYMNSVSKSMEGGNEEYKRSMQAAKKLDAVTSVISGKKNTAFQDNTKLDKQANNLFDRSINNNNNNTNNNRKK